MTPRLPARHLITLFQQMEMLLSAGVMITDALARLRDHYPDKRTRALLAEIHRQVAASRNTLSKAFAAFPRSFPPGVIAAIEAGEQGGAAMLAERFADLAERIDFQESNRRRLRKALAYPLFVICLSIGLYALLLGVVFPRLEELLVSLGGNLPPLAREAVAASHVLKRRWLAATVLAAIAAGTIAGLRLNAKAGLGIDRLLLRLPLVGGICRELMVSLVCRIYSSLHRANLSAPEIIELCSRLPGNRAFSEGLLAARGRMISRGSTLSQAFSATGLFPPIACMAIEVGEQSGQIARAMDRISTHFERRATDRIDAAIAVINPVLTLVVVGGAGLLLLSFFQSVYQIVYATH